jgi:hypothetical protein
VLNLVVAIAADTTLRRAAEAVRVYGALTPAGADVSGAPASVPRNARVVLDSLANLAADGDLLSELQIEVVSTWPEIAFHWSDGSVNRFRETGALASHWQDDKRRTSTTIPGAVFASVFKDLFK